MVYRTGFYALILVVALLGMLGLGLPEREPLSASMVQSAAAAPLAGGDNDDGRDNDDAADLRITSFDDDDDPVDVRERVTFTATVENRGPADADAVRFTVKFDPTWDFRDSDPDQGDCDYESAASRGALLSRVRCNLGEIDEDERVTVSVTLSQTTTGNFPVHAKVKPRTVSKVFDPDTSNNFRTEDTTVE